MIIFTKYPHNILIFPTIYKIICCSHSFRHSEMSFFFIIVTNYTTSGHKPQIIVFCSSFGEFCRWRSHAVRFAVLKILRKKTKTNKRQMGKVFFYIKWYQNIFFYSKGNICYFLHSFLPCIYSSCSVIMINDLTEIRS